VNARRLLPELVRRGHEVHAMILYWGGAAPSAAAMESRGVIVHKAPFHRYTEQNVRWFLRTLQAIGVDVFVPNLSVAGWYAARWAREAGVPTVAAHRSNDSFHWEMVDRFVLGPAEWAVSGIVCVNEWLCAQIDARQPQSTRTTVIPSGVPMTAKVAHHRPGPIRLVYVGRLIHEQKRVFDLIDSLARVMKLLPDAEASLIGNSAREDEDAIDRRIASHGLQDHIRRLGVIEPENLSETLAAHHVLVLLSDYEGTPGSVMDGMAAGLVPVCLDIPGGVRELVIHEKTGLLVKDRGAEFTAAVIRLAGDPVLREQLAGNARRLIEERFSLEVAADRWDCFLRLLVSESGPKTGIRYPRALELPPVCPAFAREDRRRPSLKTLSLSLVYRLRSMVRFVRDWTGRNDSVLDPFLDPRPSPGMIDLYPIRRAILEALRAELPTFHGTLLDVGCGQMPYRSLLMASPSRVTHYLGLDFDSRSFRNKRPDIVWDDGRIPLADDSVDCAICTEVLEHCPEPESVLREVLRVLRPGGRLFFTVPFLWPLHEVPYDHYRYTPFALQRHFTNAGFTEIRIRALGGWDASLSQMLASWARHRRMRKRPRKILAFLVTPVVAWLLGRDHRKPVDFREGDMITGLAGTAEKPRSGM
jgi:glycosyltransferase involved in cell wall biosynthesis/SAM-dependent methyltransferase